MRRFAGSRRFVFNRALLCRRNATARREAARLRRSVSVAHGVAPRSGDGMAGRCARAPSATSAQRFSSRLMPTSLPSGVGFRASRRKADPESFRYPDPKQIKLDQANGRLFLPKLGWLRYRNSRKVLGEVKQVTVCQLCEKWFVSIQTEKRALRRAAPATGRGCRHRPGDYSLCYALRWYVLRTAQQFQAA